MGRLTFKIYVTVATMLLATSAHAGGPLAPAYDGEPAQAVAYDPTSAFSGGVGLKFGQMAFENSDDSEDVDGLNVFGLNGHLRMDWNAWSVFADVNTVRRDIGDEAFNEYAPEGATSYGLHAGRTFGNFYGGAFVGQNRFQGLDSGSENGYVTGNLYGLEAEYKISPAGAVFGQLGKADMVGDDADTAFDGGFYRIGASYSFDRFGVAVDYERGKSDDIFEDDTDSGDYRSYGIEGSYLLTSNLSATAGYEKMDITANTEDDASESTFTLGLNFAFGAKTSRHNLTTTYKPGLAAAWAEALD